MILRRICQLSLTRITHQVSHAFDLNKSVSICVKKSWGLFSWQTIVSCRDRIPTISIYKTCNFLIYNVKRSFAICFRCLLMNAKNQPLLKEIQFPVMLIPLLKLFRIFFFHRVQIRMTANIFLTALQDADSDI